MTKNILLTETQKMEDMTDEYISPEQVKEGFKRCHTVVNRLLKDAELLMKNGRYSSSVSLAILAYEEVSKANDLRLKAKEGNGLTQANWSKMSFGRYAHDTKLSGIVDARQNRLERFNQGQADFLNLVTKKMGFTGYADLQTSRNENMLLQKIFPKLNLVKQDCFYLNWDEKGKDWTYFDRRFNEKTKKSIAKFLIITTESAMLSAKFTMDLPTKPIVQYTDEEWEKIQKSKSCDDLKKFLKYKMSREFTKISNEAIIAIDSYPEIKKKK